MNLRACFKTQTRTRALGGREGVTGGSRSGGTSAPPSMIHQFEEVHRAH
jgi:predicted YcjX-like family ATPase